MRELDVYSKKLIIGAFAPFQQEPKWFLELGEELQDGIAYPAIVDGAMIFRLARMGDLKIKNDFGPKILGPTDDLPLVLPDVALVPGLAFDESGRRLGRGKGYYDKTFEQRSEVVKIGIAFEMQITDALPFEPHDVLMNYIVTEKRIINCNSKN